MKHHMKLHLPSMRATSLHAFSLVLLLGACDKKAAEPQAAAKAEARVYGMTAQEAARPVAKVGQRVITAGDLAARLAAQPTYLQPRFNAPEERARFLDSLIRFELMALEAERLGLDKGPEAEAIRDQARIDMLIEERVFAKVAEMPTDDEALKAFFASHKAKYHYAEGRRALLGRFAAKPEAMQAFRALRRGDTPTLRAAPPEGIALTPFFDRNGQGNNYTLPAAVAEAVFTLSAEAPLPKAPLVDGEQWYVFRWVAARAGQQPTFAQLRGTLSADLRAEREQKQRTALLEELRKGAKVELDDTKLAALQKHLAKRAKERATP